MDNAIKILFGVLGESFALLNKMAPYLLLGFFFAGVLHIFLSPDRIARHLGRGNISSVIKAALFGVPLPLCSCGVIPAALSLRRSGASVGAVLAFLISTPTTGVDSIFATWAILGGVFTVFRIIAAFIIAVLAGFLANIFIDEPAKGPPEGGACPMCLKEAHGRGTPPAKRVLEAFRFGFSDLFSDVSRWLIAGVLIGGAISFFMPEKFISDYVGSGLRSYAIMYLIGTPMYVCATGSIPIAASLMAKGLSAGAAFVFLVSGPATNAVAIAAITKELGRKAAAIYLGSIFAGSIALAFVLDIAWGHAPLGAGPVYHGAGHGWGGLAQWAGPASSMILLILMARAAMKKIKNQNCGVASRP